MPKHIMTDSTRLMQILMNLIGNALKFTPDGGKISMSVSLLPEHDSGKCHLGFTIQDTGIGIDPSKAKKLFDPFEQADSSTTRNYGGTGLGIAITKMFVEMLDGHITVNSELGKGSAFTFDILADIPSEAQIREANDHMLESYPASSENESSTAGTDNSDTPFPDCTGKTFIVAEDNEINQIIAKDVIERSGASLEFANNGQEAVDLFTANPTRYSAIFMDVQMPIMDGYEATRKIRALKVPGAAVIPIIAMTSNVFAEDYRNSISAGMNAHIGKPFEPEQIALAIRKFVCSERN
jgi:CheY-like chemotaxis protein